MGRNLCGTKSVKISMWGDICLGRNLSLPFEILLWSICICGNLNRNWTCPQNRKKSISLFDFVCFLVQNFKSFWDKMFWKALLNCLIIITNSDNPSYLNSSNYSKTLTKIQSSQDYESLIMENEKFLSLIMAQSFVEMPSVKNCIVNILEVCHLFHRLMEKLSGKTEQASDYTQLRL